MIIIFLHIKHHQLLNRLYMEIFHSYYSHISPSFL
nr:MAG TPA: hypothetical protein [Bacteriophage sp.]